MPPMNIFRRTYLLLGMAVVCHSASAQPMRLPEIGTTAATSSVSTLAAVGLLQPGSETGAERLTLSNPEPLPPGEESKLSLAELEQLALAGNPVVAQAAAHVTALRGRSE